MDAANESIGILKVLEIIVAPALLALAIGYGIWRTRNRTRLEKNRTDAATRRLYEGNPDELSKSNRG
jgi:hypothetical protein